MYIRVPLCTPSIGCGTHIRSISYVYPCVFSGIDELASHAPLFMLGYMTVIKISYKATHRPRPKGCELHTGFELFSSNTLACNIGCLLTYIHRVCNKLNNFTAKSIGYVRTEAPSRWRNHLLVSAGSPGGERDDDVPCYNFTQYPHPRVERTINTERERVDTAAFGREVHMEVT